MIMISSKITFPALLALSLAAGCGSSGAGDSAKADAAKAFPAQAVTLPALKGVTVGVPPGGKLAAGGPGLDDRVTIETPDYNLIIKVGDEAIAAKVKDMVGKMKTFKGFKIDAPDGFVAQLDEPSGTQFMVSRTVKAGDKTVGCESAAFKPLKTLDKAQEAFAVCGTIKK
jgi:hypothetical protein